MEEQYLLFENYLAGELSEQEKNIFNKKLASDTNFKQNFTLYKETHNFVAQKINNEASLKDFKNELSKISEKYFEKEHLTKKASTFNLFRYGIAASFLLVFGIYMYNATQEPTYNDFVNYNTIDITVRSDQNEKLTLAENAFNTKDFNKANTYFSQLLKEDANNTELRLYKGFSLIELNSFIEADQLLTDITHSNSAYKNKANWYLALSKLKQKEFNTCISILKTIPKGATEYKTAKKLLSKLD